MKTCIVILSLFLFCFDSNAQVLKKLGEKIKRDSEWRIRSKADQQVGRGIDSIVAIPKKVKDKKKAKKEEARKTETQSAAGKTENGSSGPLQTDNRSTQSKLSEPGNDENDMEPRDGYAMLTLSANTVFTGGSITISGESIKYKNYKEVEITVTGPSVKDAKSIPLNADGKFATVWFASGKAGEYKVTLKGSDKKATVSEAFTVYEIDGLDNLCDENINLITKAFDHLKETAEQVKNSLGSKDKAELDKKLEEVKEKVDLLLKLLKDLNVAGKDISKLAKSGKNLSPNLADNLSVLNNKLKEQREKMEQVEEYRNHKPADNTVCEYLVLMNEACAAFSVYSNIECFAFKGIIKNIILDKGVPLATGTINARAKGLSSPNDFLLKEPAKIFSTAALDAESLSSKLGTAGFCGDIVQFATDMLMNKYCGVFKGKLKHDYTIEFRNKSGQNWWTYAVEMKAVLALRYPKDKGGGNIIRMKGNLEGNATKFSFFEDLEKNDEFQEGSKGKIEVVPIKAYIPFSVSAATSEIDVMGFGAIARGLATPAYFNIPVDAEYDVNENKIKLFLNAPIIDFSPAIRNQLVFLLIGGDLLPYVKRMSFPINKVFRTLGSVVRDNHEFPVVKDAKGILSFDGKANKHIGDRSSVIETDLNFTISAKKD
ncbi:MAG TPA: hypothetical protein PLU11_00415 [Chitinophagaceae bacterium]|nr:hypothetical protein [Chitinophagaceae bacterium]HPN57593.1 hypothetical protein [Chitinophagaceae bacterium]